MWLGNGIEIDRTRKEAKSRSGLSYCRGVSQGIEVSVVESHAVPDAESQCRSDESNSVVER